MNWIKSGVYVGVATLFALLVVEVGLRIIHLKTPTSESRAAGDANEFYGFISTKVLVQFHRACYSIK